MGNEFLCDQCQKTFAIRKYLSQHIRRNHSPRSQIFQCHHCKYTTKYKHALQRHVLSHVKLRPISNSPVHVCVLCQRFKCRVRDEMIHHYENAHDVQLSKEFLFFGKFEDFETWKDDIEKADVCRFTVSNGSKKRKAVDVRYYRCFRDGIYQPEGEGKRRLKLKGSIKIGGVCPASMKAVTDKETGAVHVTFIPNHVGHGEDLGCLNLTKAERAEIAAKLAQNIPYQAILDQIRTSKRNELQRIHLTTGKDIANIQASLKLGKVDSGCPHAADPTSIGPWIRLMEEETNVVRFYKPQGVVLSSHPQLLEGDMLLIIASDAQLEMLKEYGADCICFDGTRGLNPHEFELTTVLVLDELRQGFPCVFLFSNRCDSEIMSVLVRALQGVVGSIQPKVLMTDMNQIYIDGWRSCMPEPKNILFCNWHVDRDWRKNLAKVKGTEKKKEVYWTVRSLMREADESGFIQLMQKAIQKFENDPCTATFGDYFKENYSENVKQWAFCYRKNCGLNKCATHLENMYKVLKYIHQDGKKIKRLDKTILALLRTVRDKFHGQLIVRMKGKLTSKISTIKKRHETSNGMQCTILPCAEGWLVTSKSGLDMYLVRKLTITGCGCELKCQDCRICVHDFTCDCIDSMVKFNICKHIHRVASFRARGNPGRNTSEEPTEENVDCNNLVMSADSDSIENIIVAERSQMDEVTVLENNLDVKISKIREKFEEILDNLQTDEHAEILWNTLHPVIPTFNTASSIKDFNFDPASGHFLQCDDTNTHSESKRFQLR